jgi:hypothetical protein
MTACLLESARENILLAKLREEDRQRLAPHLAAIDLQAKSILQRAGEDVVDTWFPCGSAMAAFSVWVDDGSPAVEVALVGREGAVGGIVSNGNVPAYATCQVRASGRFLRIKTANLEQCKLDSITLRLVLPLFGLPARSNVPDGGLQRHPHDSPADGEVAASRRCTHERRRVRDDAGTTCGNAGRRTHLCDAYRAPAS